MTNYEYKLRQSIKYWESYLKKIETGEFVPKSPVEHIKEGAMRKIVGYEEKLFNISLS